MAQCGRRVKRARRSKVTPAISRAIGKWTSTMCWAWRAKKIEFGSKYFMGFPDSGRSFLETGQSYGKGPPSGGPPWLRFVQGVVYDGKGVAAADELCAGDAEDAAEFVRRDEQRAGRGGSARRGLRERGGHGGVEGYVALNFLHDLVDMAVEDADGAEALEVGEGLRAVVGAPTPFGIDAPEGDVREDDDGRAGRELFHVVFEPLELIGAEQAQAAGFEVSHVVEGDEVDALLVKAVPAAALGAFAEAVEEFAAVVNEHVVLAGNVVDLAGAEAFEHLGGGVELGGLGEVRDVAGVEHEFRSDGQSVDAIDGDLKRGGDVRVRGLVEAEVAVADLGKGEFAGVDLLAEELGRHGEGFEDAAVHHAEHPGAGPGHAGQEAAAVHAVVMV